jgi:hypothetical protein
MTSPRPIPRALAPLGLSLAAVCLADSAGQGGCLYLDNAESAKFSQCAEDPLHLAAQPAIRAAIGALSLSKVPIAFIGCKEAPFFTRLGRDALTRSYEIVYPIMQVPAETYVPPVTHEVAHVFQSELAGGMANLFLTTRSLQRELGADFLTGVVFKNASRVDGATFQTTVALMALYREKDENAHGTPVQRNAAFRSGAYLKFSEFDRDFKRANQEFQDNRYALIAANP